MAKQHHNVSCSGLNVKEATTILDQLRIFFKNVGIFIGILGFIFYLGVTRLEFLELSGGW